MKYAELLQFDPIESVVQLRDAGRRAPVPMDGRRSNTVADRQRTNARFHRPGRGDQVGVRMDESRPAHGALCPTGGPRHGAFFRQLRGSADAG